MPAPIYFFPNRLESELFDGKSGRIRRPFLLEYDMQEVWRDLGKKEEFSAWQCEKAVNGKSGLMVSANPTHQQFPPTIGYQPDKQRWLTFMDGRLSIGYDSQYPTKVEDIERKTTTRGYLIFVAEELGEMIIPIVRSLPDKKGRVSIRHKVWKNEQGQFVEELYDEDLELWTALELVWDAIVKEEDAPELLIERDLDLAVRLVGKNYRYGPREQELFGFVDSENWFNVLNRACDYPFLGSFGELGAQKKKARESVSSTPGEPASDQTTAPAAAS